MTAQSLPHVFEVIPLLHLIGSADNIAAMYNITAGTTAAAGNELGIYEDLGDVYSQEDLDLFFAKFAR